MKRIILSIINVLFFMSGFLFAQSDLDFSAQLRPRYIFSDKDFNSNTGFHTYGEIRSRLGVKFNPTKNLTAFFQVQDSRIFGEEPSTISNTKNVDVHQVYLQVNNLFDLPINLKAGRMEASYGTERIMARNNWNNLGRSFDGVSLQIDFSRDSETKLDLFAFRTAERWLPEDSLDENVLGAFAELQFIEGHKLQPFVIYRSSTAASYPFNAFAVGAYLTGTINGIWHQAEFISQFGDERDDGPQSLSAFFAGYNARYTFSTEIQPWLGAGIDYYSGDDDPADNKYKEFSRWFGAGHKYLGYMDYFPGNTFGVGLMDIHFKAGLKLIDKLKIKSALHIFNSAGDYTLADNSKSNSFGTEFDLVLTYDYNDYLDFEIGGGLFLPGEIFEENFGKDNSTWFYMMAVVDL
ncbi:MAG: alginate export family protein [Melioribacteraceae bacterium]|nr:alginate export family protein [Melioribacteraceae bacterium]MCF8393353.1 alginate export family protein [Melioribacteraceae bacterium]MCF8418918.1 alginate export family protein [Melioribacteraceae bacterium]